jgi:hypothetical protein
MHTIWFWVATGLLPYAIKRHQTKDEQILSVRALFWRLTIRWRQGQCSIGANLRASPSPNWLWVMRPWLDLLRPSQASQASDRPGCRDEASCDGRYTKSEALVVNTAESVQRCKSLGSADTRDRH